MAIVYRTASLEDAEALRALALQAFKHDWGIPATERQIKHYQTRMLEVDGEIAGYVIYHVEDPATAKIAGLAIDEKFKGRGLGRKLLSNTLAEIPIGPRIWLDVWANNVIARTMYESFGFVVESINERGLAAMVLDRRVAI